MRANCRRSRHALRCSEKLCSLRSHDARDAGTTAASPQARTFYFARYRAVTAPPNRGCPVDPAMTIRPSAWSRMLAAMLYLYP